MGRRPALPNLGQLLVVLVAKGRSFSREVAACWRHGNSGPEELVETPVLSPEAVLIVFDVLTGGLEQTMVLSETARRWLIWAGVRSPRVTARA
jgi:hypothetical protein